MAIKSQCGLATALCHVHWVAMVGGGSAPWCHCPWRRGNRSLAMSGHEVLHEVDQNLRLGHRHSIVQRDPQSSHRSVTHTHTHVSIISIFYYYFIFIITTTVNIVVITINGILVAAKLFFCLKFTFICNTTAHRAIYIEGDDWTSLYLNNPRPLETMYTVTATCDNWHAL